MILSSIVFEAIIKLTDLNLGHGCIPNLKSLITPLSGYNFG